MGVMAVPSYEGEEIAACAACLIPGMALSPSLVTYPCPIWWIAAAV